MSISIWCFWVPLSQNQLLFIQQSKPSHLVHIARDKFYDIPNASIFNKLVWVSKKYDKTVSLCKT